MLFVCGRLLLVVCLFVVALPFVVIRRCSVLLCVAVGSVLFGVVAPCQLFAVVVCCMTSFVVCCLLLSGVVC